MFDLIKQVVSRTFFVVRCLQTGFYVQITGQVFNKNQECLRSVSSASILVLFDQCNRATLYNTGVSLEVESTNVNKRPVLHS